MNSERAMKALADDPVAVRRLAKVLIGHVDAEWTDWELDFLESLLARRDAAPLTTRQAEKLIELRDQTVLHRTWDGFSVGALIRSSFDNRCELDEDDEAFIRRLKAEAPTALRRRPLMRLLRIARATGAIETAA